MYWKEVLTRPKCVKHEKLLAVRPKTSYWSADCNANVSIYISCHRTNSKNIGFSEGICNDSLLIVSDVMCQGPTSSLRSMELVARIRRTAHTQPRLML